MSTLLTVGEIARRLGEELHRVEYVLRARQIAPSAYAGNNRVFSDADFARVKSELEKIDERANGYGGAGDD